MASKIKIIGIGLNLHKAFLLRDVIFKHEFAIWHDIFKTSINTI